MKGLINPFVADENVSTSGSEQTVEIQEKVRQIRIVATSGTAYFYINSTSEVKVWFIEGMTLDNIDGQIGKIIIGSAAAATVNIKQTMNIGRLPIRGI